MRAATSTNWSSAPTSATGRTGSPCCCHPRSTASPCWRTRTGSVPQSEWCDAIVLPLQQTIATKYPFDSTAHFDARLDDLKAAVSPGDRRDRQFRGEHLRGYVDARGTIHTRDIGTAATLHLNTRVVDVLDAAHKLGLLLFRDSEAGIDMGVTMACEETISKVVLTVDDTEHPYICSVDQSRQIHWPGKADKRRGLLDAHGTNGRHDHISRDGEFGLFRLLEAGAPKRRAGQSAFGLAYDFKRYNLGIFRDGRRTSPIPRR